MRLFRPASWLFSKPFLLFCVLAGLPSVQAAWAASDPSGKLSVVLAITPPEKLLKTWSFEDFQGAKQTTTREKDPNTSEMVVWKGISISKLVDQAISALSVEQKAQIDLLILKGKD